MFDVRTLDTKLHRGRVVGAADQRLRAEDAAACRCVGSDRGRRRREGGAGEHDPGDERAGPRGSALDEEAEEEIDQLVPELIPKLVRNLKAWRETQRFHDRAVVQSDEGPSRRGQRIAWRAGACQSSRQRRRVRCTPSCMRAAANTPAEPASALVAHFPADGSLPRFTGGSASALPVSRPAQRSPKLRPACSLNRPWRPFSSECFRRRRYLLRPLRLLPAGATVAGRDSHPLRDGAFARRTAKSG